MSKDWRKAGKEEVKAPKAVEPKAPAHIPMSFQPQVSHTPAPDLDPDSLLSSLLADPAYSTVTDDLRSLSTDPARHGGYTDPAIPTISAYKDRELPLPDKDWVPPKVCTGLYPRGLPGSFEEPRAPKKTFGQELLNGVAGPSPLATLPLGMAGWVANEMGLGPGINQSIGEVSSGAEQVWGGVSALTQGLPVEEAGQALMAQPGVQAGKLALGPEGVDLALQGVEAAGVFMDDVTMAKGFGMGAKALTTGLKGLEIPAPESNLNFGEVDLGPGPGMTRAHSGFGGLFDDGWGFEWPGESTDLPEWRGKRRPDGMPFGEDPTVDAVRPVRKDVAGMARKDRHHTYPDEHRSWFEDRGFVDERNIDNHTLPLSEGDHQAIHGGGDWRLARKLTKMKSEGEVPGRLGEELQDWSGEWNTATMDHLRKTEKQLGRKLDYGEVRRIVDEEVAPEFGLSPEEYIPYKDKKGR